MVIILYLWYIQNGAPKLLLMAQPLKHPQSESDITAQGPRLRNDLYCVEWDVKLYHTIPYHDNPSTLYLLNASAITIHEAARCWSSCCGFAQLQGRHRRHHWNSPREETPRSLLQCQRLFSIPPWWSRQAWRWRCCLRQQPTVGGHLDRTWRLIRLCATLGSRASWTSWHYNRRTLPSAEAALPHKRTPWLLLEASVDVMSTALPTATVVLVGDFNTLDDSEVNSRSALNSIVNRPTRGAHNLDRIYISDACYENVQVARSTVKSDHQAVIAYTGPRLLPQNKSREQCTLRLRSPTQNALFLEHASNLKISFSDDTDMRINFDNMYMYAITRDLLNRFYPERTITVTSFDPRFVTAESMMVHHLSLNDVSTICCHQKRSRLTNLETAIAATFFRSAILVFLSVHSLTGAFSCCYFLYML